MKKLLVLAMALILIVSLCAVFASAEAKNVAAGKTYTTTGIHKNDDGSTPYPDTNSKELTDGVLPAKADVGYTSQMWVGFNIGGEKFGTDVEGHSTITVNLGSAVSGIKAFKLYSEECGSGISAAEEVEVLVSSDNKTFTSVGKSKGKMTISADNAAEPTFGIYEYTVAPAAASTAQYVKFSIKHKTNWVFVSEVEALTGDVEVTPTSEPTVESEAESTAVSDETVADNSAPESATSTEVESSVASAADSTVSVTSDTESKEGNEGGIGTWGIVGIIAGVAVVVGGGIFLVTRKK